jgi:hypothetical protein
MNTETEFTIKDNNIDNSVIEPVFDFKKGDVVEFCDEQYYVIVNFGSSGVVCPLGETYYVNNFYWNYCGEITKFVRKSTNKELESLDLKMVN